MSEALDNGVGNDLDRNGDIIPWTVPTLHAAMGGEPSDRALQYWFDQSHPPSGENLRKFCWVISNNDPIRRKAWINALDTALRAEKTKKKNEETINEPTQVVGNVEPIKLAKAKPLAWLIGVSVATIATIGGVYVFKKDTLPPVSNIRICTPFYFDEHAKECTKHVPVMVEGVERVLLSFDFNNVHEGAPFERWWIHNSIRVAGRTSYNDAAWPGWTFWQPGGPLKVGQYVVRVELDETVYTQTFYVQKEEYLEKE